MFWEGRGPACGLALSRYFRWIISTPRGGRLRAGFVRIRIFRIKGFSGLRFRLARSFAIIGNPANPNMNKRLPNKDARRENPENPLILKILILTNGIRQPQGAPFWIPAFAGMTMASGESRRETEITALNMGFSPTPQTPRTTCFPTSPPPDRAIRSLSRRFRRRG